MIESAFLPVCVVHGHLGLLECMDGRWTGPEGHIG